MRTRSPAFHRQVFAHLREVSQELPGGEVVERGVERGAEALERGVGAVTERVGGPARVRAVLLLASVLALSAADTGAIAAIAPRLETSLHIGNVQIGLLVTVSALAAATGMLPVGWVTDRSNRVRMVAVAVVLWSVAEVVSALSPDYIFLVIVRVALGALTAVTGPTLASLTGDLFPARERSEIYGYILAGELVGAGLGLLVAGLVSSVFTWRPALAVLAIPSFALAWLFHRHLPEPARGGQSRLERGATEIVTAEDVEEAADAAGPSGAEDVAGGRRARAAADTASPPPQRDESPMAREVRRRHIDPDKGLVLDRDPLELGWWEAFRYVLAVRSNFALIAGSALGYFFFGGVETFALIYLEGHYGIGQAVATLVALAVGGAAIAGAVVGGRGTDGLLHRGRLDARFLVPAVAFAGMIVVFAPAVISTSLIVAIPLFLVAGFCIGAPNPGLDSARLDVMPSRMWGRGEAVRSFLRSILQAFAPLVFGLVSSVFGGRAAGFGVTGHGTHVKNAASHAVGLEQTFLIMLVALGAAAVIVWWGRRPYAVDVAAATETERRFPPMLDAGRPAGEPDRPAEATSEVEGPFPPRAAG
ncbi:MAG TPA: MFS transporter [Acidimicrobiales bacterium]|nr:MFS transporter [Acidimicrobiales bacterium]